MSISIREKIKEYYQQHHDKYDDMANISLGRYEHDCYYNDYGDREQTIEEFYKNIEIECKQDEEQLKKDGYIYKVLTLDSDNYDGFPKNIVADFFDEDMELAEGADTAILGVNYEIINDKLIKE